MSDDPVYILSTGAIPGFQYTGRIIVEIIPFNLLELNPYDHITKKIDQLALQAHRVVFTSANAAEAVGLILNGKQPDWKIYCIAHSTREKVLEYFINPNIGGLAANSSDLADLIITGGNEAVVFFCGNLRKDDIPSKMKEKNIMLDELIVYNTVYTPVKTARQYSGILFFSPGAVESFFSENDISPGVIMFAIGNTTASEIRRHCTNEIFTPGKPDKLELAQIAINYFEEKINQ